MSNLAIDKKLCQDQKQNIILVDDVITQGAHFKACKTLLQQEFPNSKIKGLFIARTVH
jgi:predicted amidophosphoribosyltransferase